ncbi:Hypothetical protein PHPALM_20086 [Phytophthora palmivora]|uniref:Uncharacterized protein n=1 Tax=Phytophthora palmivora TaxID=4796 RepID=A0A2P4XFQ7_9STRA|nr:Hypothetical protein PHPALM_20086 [Phytophthora palmivora]
MGFDPGKVSNAKYFSETTCLNGEWGKHLVINVGGVCNKHIFRGAAFFYEGADFCGVSGDFIERNGLQGYVVTFGNEKDEVSQIGPFHLLSITNSMCALFRTTVT